MHIECLMSAGHVTILGDQYKHDLQKMVSFLSALVLFLSYRHKKNTLWKDGDCTNSYLFILASSQEGKKPKRKGSKKKAMAS